MIVLIADKFDQDGIEELRACGCELTQDAALQGDALRDAIARIGPAILIVHSTRVTADMIEASDDLALIIRAGAGCNTIDVAAASSRGVPVANPGKNAEAVRIAWVFAATGEVPHCVNIESRSEAACTMVVRHYDKVGVLAGVLDKLRRARIHVEEMSNTIYQGCRAAVAVIRLSAFPDEQVVASIAAVKDEVIGGDVKAIHSHRPLSSGGAAGLPLTSFRDLKDKSPRLVESGIGPFE